MILLMWENGGLVLAVIPQCTAGFRQPSTTCLSAQAAHVGCSADDFIAPTWLHVSWHLLPAGWHQPKRR
jgi:hypothetical protein